MRVRFSDLFGGVARRPAMSDAEVQQWMNPDGERAKIFWPLFNAFLFEIWRERAAVLASAG